MLTKINEYNTKYYQKNKENLKNKRKEYCLKNKDKIKEYYTRPEVKLKVKEYNKRAYLKRKEKRKEYNHIYFIKNKENLTKNHRLWVERNRDSQKEYQKKYYLLNKEQKIEKCRNYYFSNKSKVREYKKRKLKEDLNYSIGSRLVSLLWHAMTYYSKTGKIMSSRKYGINYQAIIEHLKPFPEDISKYHIDHIKPLCSFDLDNIEEVKKAFAPENHQWLTISENCSKGKKSQEEWENEINKMNLTDFKIRIQEVQNNPK